MDWSRIVKECFDTDAVLYSNHARREMKAEAFGEILEREVYEAISASEMIEEYPNDKPYPSALLFGRTASDRPLHVVCAYDATVPQVIVVTVYHPDPTRWDDYQRRKT